MRKMSYDFIDDYITTAINCQIKKTVFLSAILTMKIKVVKLYIVSF